jgi:hypothetical protein
MLMLHSSCAHLAMMAMGMKQPKELNRNQLQRFNRKMNIPEPNSFFADTSYWNLFINLPKEGGVQKNHYQPIQAIYFNKGSKYPTAWYINCYAKATTFNLLWNADSSFNVFPPKGNAPLDSAISISSFDTYIHPVFPSSKYFINPDEINIIVIYNRVFQRQSRNLIRLVQQNAALSETPVHISYINIDNAFSDSEKEFVN